MDKRFPLYDQVKGVPFYVQTTLQKIYTVLHGITNNDYYLKEKENVDLANGKGQVTRLYFYLGDVKVTVLKNGEYYNHSLENVATQSDMFRILDILTHNFPDVQTVK